MFSSMFGVQRKYCILPVSSAAEFRQVIPPILARLFDKIKFHTKRRKGVCFFGVIVADWIRLFHVRETSNFVVLMMMYFSDYVLRNVYGNLVARVVLWKKN